MAAFVGSMATSIAEVQVGMTTSFATSMVVMAMLPSLDGQSTMTTFSLRGRTMTWALVGSAAKAVAMRSLIFADRRQVLRQ
ncbi:hypothetical protein ACFLIN_09700 [Corynebacterium kutscheri]|uniref:hypothetical protein n=1 Tax=Corynebacterium kutscheri TaxID=35755 RepID=UPI0037BFF94B